MKRVVVNDRFQKNYSYELVAPIGKEFAADFAPELSPEEMLALGIFGGWYFEAEQTEFPQEWFATAKLNWGWHDPKLNFFGVNASQPLAVWQAKGWIYKNDPRGWVQWYFRYYYGRRLGAEDRRQDRPLESLQKTLEPGSQELLAR